MLWSCMSSNKIPIYFVSLLELDGMVWVNVILDSMITSCKISVVLTLMSTK